MGQAFCLLNIIISTGVSMTIREPRVLFKSPQRDYLRQWSWSALPKGTQTSTGVFGLRTQVLKYYEIPVSPRSVYKLKGNQNPHIRFSFIIKYSLLRTTSESLNKMYCITIIADKNKEVTSFTYHSKEAWIHSVHCEPAICQNLEKMGSWYSLQEFRQRIRKLQLLKSSNLQRAIYIKNQVFFYYKVFIIENNQWKFEQNQAKNKEVTAFEI